MTLVISALFYLNPKVSLAQEKNNVKLYYLIRGDNGQPKTYNIINSGVVGGWFVNYDDTKEYDSKGFVKPILHTQKKQKKQ
jgi:hypothetical protein